MLTRCALGWLRAGAAERVAALASPAADQPAAPGGGPGEGPARAAGHQLPAGGLLRPAHHPADPARGKLLPWRPWCSALWPRRAFIAFLLVLRSLAAQGLHCCSFRVLVRSSITFRSHCESWRKDDIGGSRCQVAVRAAKDQARRQVLFLYFPFLSFPSLPFPSLFVQGFENPWTILGGNPWRKSLPFFIFFSTQVPFICMALAATGF